MHETVRPEGRPKRPKALHYKEDSCYNIRSVGQLDADNDGDDGRDGNDGDGADNDLACKLHWLVFVAELGHAPES